MNAGEARRGPALILGAAALLYAVTQSMVVPLFPSIRESTGGGTAELSWLLTGPLVVAAALTPAIGRWADLRGKKPTLVLTLAAMTAGGVLLSVTSSAPLLIAGRCLQGVGGAFVPVAISLLRDLVPAREFSRGVGVMSGALGLGIALGVPLAAAVADIADWHVSFAAVTLLTGLVLALVRLRVPEGRRDATGQRFDAVGAIVLAVILAVLMLAITVSGEAGPLDGGVLSAFVLVAAATAGWTVHQLRSPAPVVDVRLAIRMPVAITNVIAFFIGFAMFANILVVTQAVQVPASVPWGHGLTLWQAGLFIAPAGIAMVVFAPVSARITARSGAKVTMIVALPMLIGGYLLQMLVPELWALQLGLIVANIGVAMGYAALPVLISQEVPSNATASANSLNVLARMIGHATCSAVSAAMAISFHVEIDGADVPERIAFSLTLAIAIATSLIALLLTFLLPRRGSAPRADR